MRPAATQVLILTGACGVGKSTLSKAWARHHRGAVIECDWFTEWIHDPAFPHWTAAEEQFVALLSARNACTYLEYGLPVAIENVWFPPGLDRLRQEIWAERPQAEITCVYLFCQLGENHRRDQLRPPKDQMKDRVDIVHQQLFTTAWPEYVFPLDTTELNEAESLAAMLACRASSK